MDSATLANQVMTILTPIVPYLSSAGTAVAAKIGEDVYQQAKTLYEAVRTRFARESDSRASKALQAFVEDTDLASAVEIKLQRLIEADATFAETLRQIIQAGPRMTLTVEESQARLIRMTNKTGTGTQDIRGIKGSIIEDVQMNME